jgi:hypothetical protein
MENLGHSRYASDVDKRVQHLLCFDSKTSDGSNNTALLS